jgi:hypothetical protein
MSNKIPLLIGKKLTPEMIWALPRGWAENGATASGMAARCLVRPGSPANDLRLTPMGKQWAEMIETMRRTYGTLEAIRTAMVPDHVRDMAAQAMSAINVQAWPK